MLWLLLIRAAFFRNELPLLLLLLLLVLLLLLLLLQILLRLLLLRLPLLPAVPLGWNLFGCARVFQTMLSTFLPLLLPVPLL